MLEEKIKYLSKDSEIWKRIKDILKKDFDIEVIHNEKYILTKIKPLK